MSEESDMNDEDTLRKVRVLLEQAASLGGDELEIAKAIGASAANLLAGVVHRNAKVIPFWRKS